MAKPTWKTMRRPTLFTYEQIKDGILGVENKQDRLLFAITYANGCRISETLQVRAENIRFDNDFVYLSSPVLKKRVDTMRNPPICRFGIEQWLSGLLVSDIIGLEGKVIRYSKRTAQYRFDKYWGCTAHSFRHTRATHCFVVLGLGMRQVVEWFKISDSTINDWAMRYSHLDTAALAEHLKYHFKEDLVKT